MKAAAAPPAPEVIITTVTKAGPLDRGTAKRNWQAVLVEVKKVKPARANVFASVEIDVDPDGTTLVIEFPSDQEFSLQMAEEPEMRDLLRGALGRVFGAPPPFRYQLGRGAVRPAVGIAAAEPVSVKHTDVSPEEAPPVNDDDVPGDYYESATGQTEPVREHETPTASDLESVLEQMGARIVSEHQHTPDGEDE